MHIRPTLAVDLGTVNTLVHVGGHGVSVDEPSAVVVDRAHRRPVAVGREAAALAGKTPPSLEVVYPLRHGVITDFDAAALLIQAALQRAHPPARLLAPLIVVCVPTGATWVERRAVTEAVAAVRPRATIRLVDEPVAASIGAHPGSSMGTPTLVVDIGGGTTEVALVSGTGIIGARSLRLGGNTIDDAVVYAVKRELGLVIGHREAERLKIAAGLGTEASAPADVFGIDPAGGSVRVTAVPEKLVATAAEPVVGAVVDAVEELLWDMPADLARDIRLGGIDLAGGGALLRGLDARILSATGITAAVVDDPLRCVVRGAAEMATRPECGARPHAA